MQGVDVDSFGVGTGEEATVGRQRNGLALADAKSLWLLGRIAATLEADVDGCYPSGKLASASQYPRDVEIETIVLNT